MPQRVAKPVHVPEHLVVDFDFSAPPGGESDIHAAWKALQQGPALFWTPHFGGHWVATRADDIVTIQQDGRRFSHAVVSLPRDSKPVKLVPLESDPPEHAVYRAVINPVFAPKALRELEAQARAITVELVERLAPQGRCEFVSDFARHVPVKVFLQLVGLPLEHREMFLGWVEETVRAPDADARRAGFSKAVEYLKELIRERQANPTDDLFGKIIGARVWGRPLNDEELLGMTTLLFFGGLDTVVNLLTFFALFLARHPEHRRELHDSPDLIPRAVEELIRRHGLVNTTRLVTEDTVLRDVQLRKGDIVMIPNMLVGLDDDKNEKPMRVDFRRQNIQHAAFGNGSHRCVGANLARAELRVFLEEWLRRIPDFEVEPGERIEMLSGPVVGVRALPLVWKAA